MPDNSASLNVLSAIITPAVLITACGTLVFSTSTRLSRIVDRVRELSRMIEAMANDESLDFPDEKFAEIERQISNQTKRVRYIQNSLTAFYVALSLLVAATVAIGLTSILQITRWLPDVLGMAGTFFLFYGSIMLIIETRFAVKSVQSEMSFALMMHGRYKQLRDSALNRELAELPKLVETKSNKS